MSAIELFVLAPEGLLLCVLTPALDFDGQDLTQRRRGEHSTEEFQVSSAEKMGSS